jgi:thioesterase domain-containing protein/acyl carrier protein
MVVHSPFLSPGYWRRPDLNAKAFADDPDRPGWRIYTSGDLGCINSDGDLCFLGRKDHRVKIRGNTVDTAEVEAALRECPWIRNVAVTAREDDAGEASRQLMAFIEAGEAPEPVKRPAALREFLKDRLPSYMIPARFAFLESLPRTASGKLDRKALDGIEIPTEPEPRGEADAVAESVDELVETVRAAFQEILRLKSIRPSDDFFLLGGDSLKATQLHLELEGYLGRRIPLEKLFAQPTVDGIAAFLRQWRNESSDTDSQDHRLVVPLREKGSRPKLFLTHGAKGQAFVSPHFLRLIGEDQPVYAFQAMGLDRARMPHHSIEEMAAEYVRALREIQPRGPYFLGSICVGGVLTLEMARQLAEAGETVGPLLLIDPPVVPPGHRHWWKRYRRARRARLKKKRFQASSNHKLARKWQEKKRKGTNFIDVDDAEVMTKAAHAAFDFELALLKHRVKPYGGDVMILRSKERQAKQHQRRYKRIKLKYPFEGAVRMWEIEGKHDQLLDVNNEDFAVQLPKCMAEVWRTFESVGNR